ncbi:MAG: hypothetical protein WC595_02530 [Candidatus Nanoarchaeia archaeon]
MDKKLIAGIILIIVSLLMSIFKLVCSPSDRICPWINGGLDVFQEGILILGILLVFLNYYRIVRR